MLTSHIVHNSRWQSKQFSHLNVRLHVRTHAHDENYTLLLTDIMRWPNDIIQFILFIRVPCQQFPINTHHFSNDGPSHTFECMANFTQCSINGKIHSGCQNFIAVWLLNIHKFKWNFKRVREREKIVGVSRFQSNILLYRRDCFLIWNFLLN